MHMYTHTQAYKSSHTYTLTHIHPKFKVEVFHHYPSSIP